ncbi:MAG: FIST C-terminal domain-containing protein [Gammaproteobacteria bacterium]|nr:FIST C-terminal domain-containing protein [Gammaproteobacteria bacterium]
MLLKSDKTLYLDNPETPRIKEIFCRWAKLFPKGGVLALVAEQSTDIVSVLQEQANDVTYPLVGAVFPELITGNELVKQGVLLVCFEEMPAHSIVPLPHNNSESDKDICGITNCLNLEIDDAEQSLFMIFDAMVPNISSIIDNIYLKIGDVVNYMGVNAGSETFQPINCLFDNNTFTGDAVLIMGIKQHHGAFLEHGYTKPDVSISATSTTGNRISSIDWRPAFDVYKELARDHYGIEINEENFYENAVHFPFGIMRMDGEMLVRIPVALEGDGSIFCVGEVPENAILTLLKAVSPGSTKTVDSLAGNIENLSEDTILTFYCAGRRMHMGDAALNELALLNKKLDHKNIVGALSLGEIGGSKQGGYPLFHNAAFVAIPWK